MTASKTALVVGASGIVGSATAALLVQQGWTVHGLARRPTAQEGVQPLVADLQDADATAAALGNINPDAVFITTWLRQDSEAENIRVNAAMVRNLLNGLPKPTAPRHVALVTGLKHYLGPFEAYGKGALPQTPFREEQGRLDVENFYYAQEDELFAAAERDGFTWSVHRPHTVIGMAVGNAMNMGTTLAVYASLCRETGRPFTFPGSMAQWSGLTDMTDARQLARQLLWATQTDAAHNEAFNIVNGDVFRWEWMWGRIAEWFGVTAAPFDGTVRPLEQQMAGDRRSVGADRRARRPCRARSQPPRLAVAHRCRSGPPDRGGDRHVEEPPDGLPCLSADRRCVLRPVHQTAQ